MYNHDFKPRMKKSPIRTSASEHRWEQKALKHFRIYDYCDHHGERMWGRREKMKDDLLLPSAGDYYSLQQENCHLLVYLQR